MPQPISSLLFASSNPHKVAEVRAIMEPCGYDLIGLDDLEALRDVPQPVEDGETFEANARLKAVHYACAARRLCLADDSGLEVDALGGRPGVHSARFAAADGPRAVRDEANNEKLLSDLANVVPGQRTARFVCSMCLADETGRVLAETRGTFEGVIAESPRGTNGFGYDPLLYLPDAGCTSAELSPEAKNARSHRGIATREMAQRIATLTDATRP